MKLIPTDKTKKIYESKIEDTRFFSIEFEKIVLCDYNFLTIQNKFEQKFIKKYNLKISSKLQNKINNKKKIRITISSIQYKTISIKNFFIQSVGIFILYPWRKGLSYSMKINGNITILNNDNSLFNSLSFQDQFIVNYMSKRRANVNFVCIILYIPTLSASTVINGLIPSSFDEKMKNSAIKIYGEKYYFDIMSKRILNLLKKNQ